jgi:ketosteroid isomerase-like protein
MSRENVEIVRSLFDAVARHDSEAVLAHYDPDVVWQDEGTPRGEFVGGTVHRGHDGIRAWFREWYEAFEDVTYEVDELIDAGADVVSIVTMRGRGRASGALTERPQFAVWTVSGGKVSRVAWYSTREAALEAAGAGE